VVPCERRAFAKVIRELERAGACRPAEELRQLIESSGYLAQEIDRGIELLVSDEGRTVGGTLRLDQLADSWRDELEREGMISEDPVRARVFTAKGATISRLLDAYAELRHVGRLGEPSEVST
jgi:hypothetical protein